MQNEHIPGTPQAEDPSPWRSGDFIGVLLAAFIVIPYLIAWLIGALKGSGVLPSWPASATMLLALYGQELALYWLSVGSVVKGYGASLQSIGIFTSRSLRHWCWGLFLGGPALIILEQAGWILTRALAVVLIGENRTAAILAQENSFLKEMLGAGATAHWWATLAFLVLVIVVAPLAEEVFFRGFGYVLLRQRWGAGTTLAFTSLIFALVHGYTIQFFPILLVGAGLGWVREKRGAVEASWGAHLALNLWASWQMLMGR